MFQAVDGTFEMELTGECPVGECAEISAGMVNASIPVFRCNQDEGGSRGFRAEEPAGFVPGVG